jgi:hypothetical protein
MNRGELRKLSESINNHLDGIILAGSQRQIHDKIHTDGFPLPGMTFQRLQQIGMSEMIYLDPSTSVTFCNMVSSLVLHSCSPELCFQFMVHLGATRVDRIFGCMGFIKDLSQPLVTQNDYSVIEP